MKEKFLSFLILFSLAFGFVSCGEEDKSDEAVAEVMFKDGVEDGKSFAEAYSVYKTTENTADKALAGVSLYKEYEKYKKNSENADYKKGFIAGMSGLSDNEKVQEAKNALEKLEGIDFSNLNWKDALEQFLKTLN